MYTLSNPCSTSHKNKKRTDPLGKKSSSLNQEEEEDGVDDDGADAETTQMEEATLDNMSKSRTLSNTSPPNIPKPFKFTPKTISFNG